MVLEAIQGPSTTPKIDRVEEENQYLSSSPWTFALLPPHHLQINK